MREVTGNLWSSTIQRDITVITTNGVVKNNGEAVMGRGCALEAAQRFPGIARTLGILLNSMGNHVHELKPNLWTFPTKHDWRDPSSISLIKRSAEELVTKADADPSIKSVLIPRPGVGNGQLNWPDVKAVIEHILDDRFTIISF